MKKYFSLFLIIFALLFFSCKTLPKEKQTTLNGMLYDYDNEPVPSALISIKGTDISVRTDIYGHFRIDKLLANTLYTATVTKNLYETTSVPFQFSNITQVLYIQIYSANQLLEKAEKEIQNKKYTIAQKLLIRCKSAGDNQTATEYLAAVIDYRQNKYNDAVRILTSLAQKDTDTADDSYIYLFLADIYQYKLQDYKKTVSYLSLFLKQTYNPEIEKRKNNLCTK